MAVPGGVKYAVIGAGIHGLSTAYHLALKLKETGRGSGKDVVVVDKTGIAAGRLRHRLRGGPQQLFPAGDARADGAFGRGLGERSRGLFLSPGRLYADQPRSDA